jgi:hypothetical protein
MLTKLLGIGLCFLAFTFVTFSQSYNIIMTNGEFVDDNNFEFDILIKSNDEEIELTSYQASLIHYIEDSHELEFSYIEGSSQLNNIPIAGIGCADNSDGKRLLTFASFPGKDLINLQEIKIGRFVLTSNQILRRENQFIFWNFEGDLTTIITGRGFNDITSSGNFLPSNSASVGADNEDEGIIKEFDLLQNYPNPFNPTTTIKYKIPFESSVKLKVFNIIGEEVKTLVNEILSQGVYEYTFDAASLSSGYYIYSLYVNNKIKESKKMILLK